MFTVIASSMSGAGMRGVPDRDGWLIEPGHQHDRVGGSVAPRLRRGPFFLHTAVRMDRLPPARTPPPSTRSRSTPGGELAISTTTSTIAVTSPDGVDDPRLQTSWVDRFRRAAGVQCGPSPSDLRANETNTPTMLISTVTWRRERDHEDRSWRSL